MKVCKAFKSREESSFTDSGQMSGCITTYLAPLAGLPTACHSGVAMFVLDRSEFTA